MRTYSALTATRQTGKQAKCTTGKGAQLCPPQWPQGHFCWWYADCWPSTDCPGPFWALLQGDRAHKGRHYTATLTRALTTKGYLNIS